MRLFSKAVVIPLCRDPFLGAAYPWCLESRLFFFSFFSSGFLVAGVRKTQEDTLKVFILAKIFSMQNNKHKGGIECGTQTNIKYIYIFEW